MKSHPRYHSLILAAVISAVLVVLTTGCHTAEGFGKDVEKTGEKIQEKAD